MEDHSHNPPTYQPQQQYDPNLYMQNNIGYFPQTPAYYYNNNNQDNNSQYNNNYPYFQHPNVNYPFHSPITLPSHQFHDQGTFRNASSTSSPSLIQESPKVGPPLGQRKKATTKAKRKEVLPEIEAAAEVARRELIGAGQGVLVWKVARLTLAKLHADSWDSLGFCLDQIPFFHRLILAEAKNVNDSIPAFVATWKEACQEYKTVEVFEKMLELHLIKKGKRDKLIRIFSTYPLVGFLSVGVISIKRGMWDIQCDTLKLRLGSNVDDSIRTFVTTWKEACQKYAAAEVFDKMMEFYVMNAKSRSKLRPMFLTYPLVGFLNVAVTSIKRGMWDSLFCTNQSSGVPGPVNLKADESTGCERLDVESIEKDPGQLNEGGSKSASCVDVEDIVRKTSEYLVETAALSSGSSLLESLLMFVKQFCYCKAWLAEQFSVNEFELLGHGDFLSLFERNISVFEKELLKSVKGEVQEHRSMEVSMVPQQLVMFLSQASTSLWDDKVVTKEKISELLRRQFPSIRFKSLESRGLQEFLDIVRQHRSSVPSNNVLYSATLLGTSDYAHFLRPNESGCCDNSEVMADSDHFGGNLGPVTSKDAVEVLLKAPFLSDLNLWSHWEVLYAPSLGPLLEWLTEVNAKDLMCLLSRDAKIIRIDHLASGDMFLQALIQESSFQIAVQLLSLFVLSGGKRHVPLSLLKCQARQGFDVILANSVQNVVLDDCQKGEKLFREHDTTNCDLSINLVENARGRNRALRFISRIFIDCLALLPSEFRCFAADVLFSGLLSLFKDAASAVLLQCDKIQERLMLHEVGWSLGIVEWINDYYSLSPIKDNKSLISNEASSFTSVGPDVKKFDCILCPSNELPFSAALKCGQCDTGVSTSLAGPEENSLWNSVSHHEVEQDLKEKEAALIIESIRREDFGLYPDNSNVESSLMQKQHARLGRALHCLSQELYAQDAHFLLELVQNADDNVYPGNVEPTLSFILERTRIIVLNNERGFTAENIRALCDIGNSTKKGSSAGYIGQKGIGFKSVFRVTDAPEIHSNGFHVKFDISEGLIGFVLPTIIPPFNIEIFDGLESGGDVEKGMKCCKTCIIMPFKSNLSDGSAASSILSMFSDIQPSLLLFLHRLQCIKLRSMLDDSHIVMRKEIMGDGIVRVSHGKEKTPWFLTSKKLHPKVNRPNVDMTEISIALMLKETVDSEYEACLYQQPVYAFLPLRTYGLKFILQANFVLPSSREEVDGDSPWNQWLLSEFPGLFVSAEKSLCGIPCFLEKPAKAVNAFMSFVPLIGEVHGFFSGLPRMIISKLRQSNCLLQHGSVDKWVPPCKVLRGWNNHVEMLMPSTLLYEYLGVGLLHKDIGLTDALARALGIEEYGPKTLVQFITSLGHIKDGIKSMGLGWLFSWLNEFYSMFHSGALNKNSGLELDLINSLKNVPFIPLSDGTYGSLDEGTIWIHDYIGSGAHDVLGNKTFPYLYGTLRIVSSALFSESSDVALVVNCTRILQKMGAQLMSAHELIRSHILPSISDDKFADKDPQLSREYIAFVMLHLQSSCIDCQVEIEHIISILSNKVLILTNYGYKRPIEIPIHFSREFGNSIDASKFVDCLNHKWHEVDTMYLKHPISGSMSSGLTNWREFFQKLGVTDFVKVVLSEKSISDLSPALVSQMIYDRHPVSPELMFKDWESPELVHILSLLSKDGRQERCKYLLEVLDALWDDCFSDKAFGYCSSITAPSNLLFKSSLLTCISDTKWVVSSIDSALHYPRDLFYDCDDVRSILGHHAPYAIPKINSVKLLGVIGFKTHIVLNDVLAILQSWRWLKSPFTASLSQMCKFYTFIWKEMVLSRQLVVEAFSSGPFIFVPHVPVQIQDDLVGGIFLSLEEVYWRDPTGAVDHIKDVDVSVRKNSIFSKKKKKKKPVGSTSIHLCKTLCSLYPGLHDFFVIECGVNEAPPFRHYLQILQHLSWKALPIEAATMVFQIVLRWSGGLRSGALCPNDMAYLKECLSQLEFTVLPSMQDKWVSLHPSFGLVCWCDDDSLKKEFEYLENIVFLYFGELTDNEKEMLHTEVSLFLRNLGIPSLSEVVSREAIYYGLADSGDKTSMVQWVLPFAQRYLYNLHPEKYSQIKHSGFIDLHHLRVVVVEKLFYRSIIVRYECVSTQHYECCALLQDNILYTTRQSDPHSVFMELSRLLFDGTPELHLANFLHMITVMKESGSTEEHIEVFILNSQKMVKLPNEESVWSLSSPLPPPENYEMISIRTQALITDQNCNLGISGGVCEDMVQGQAHVVLTDIKDNVDIEDNTIVEFEHTVYPVFGHQIDQVLSMSLPSTEAIADTNTNVECVYPEEGKLLGSGKDQLLSITSGAQQAMLTGRQGELKAFEYFVEKAGGAVVKWVNQEEESGLPYDIVIGEEERREYIEVKASRYLKKDWFEISTREWQFAAEKGDSFSVAHVILSGKNLARLIVYKNPINLCKTGKLKLAVMTPKCD